MLRAHRQRGERFVGDRRLPPDVLHVDHRRGARDGDGLLDAADGHRRVDVRRDPRRQLDSLPDERSEARKSEGDRVDAGPQVDDRVQALTVGDGDPLAPR